MSFTVCWLATASTAHIYYRWQRPKIMESARGYSLHWAFSQTNVTGAEELYDLMVKRRFEAMVANMELNPRRDDASVEKDKCEMYRFLQRNSLPHLSPSMEWHSLDKLNADLQSGEVFQNVTAWPVFLKACHLTMGVAAGVARIRQVEPDGTTTSSSTYQAVTKDHAVLSSLPEIASWAGEKWKARPVDAGRLWQKPADELCSVLKPGFLLQPSVSLSRVEETNSATAMELKVYTMWGRAHLAMMVDANCLFIRGSRDEKDAEYLPTDGLGSVLYLHKYIPSWIQSALPHDSMQWIISEGHMACVWALAERVAKTMKIDELRVDIFLIRGKPASCLVNEISLSSGHGQSHFRSLWANMWAQPHLDKAYSLWGDANSKSVYMLDEDDS
jgi:hypothetical protein